MESVLEASFFDGRLKLLNSKCLNLERDVLVVPCYPDILSGGDLFKEVIEIAGESIRESLAPFVLYDPGSCKITFAGELKNYKRLAMCVLPEMFQEEGLSFLDRLKVAMAIADALDLSVEMAAESIVFSHWNIASVEQAAEILLLCIAKWIRTSVYGDRVREVVLALEDEHVFDIYFNLAQLIEGDPSLVLDVLQQMPEDEQDPHHTEHIEQYPIDLSDISQQLPENSVNNVHVKQERRVVPPYLFFSRNLSSSILSIEQPNESLRQYRLSTTISEKNTHYFRCSRCDHLNKHRPDMGIFRPKITIRDGEIASDRFPLHHPLCEEITKANFVVQQLDRMWKGLSPYETDDLRQAYTSLRHIAQTDADALYREMDTPAGRFPEWEVLRSHTQKLHSQFSLRLIKCTPGNPMPGVSMHTLSSIREVEGEIDGGKQSGGVAWLTEADEPDPENDPARKAAPQESASGSRGIIRRKNETPTYKFRLVRPKADTSPHSSSAQASPEKRSRPEEPSP